MSRDGKLGFITLSNKTKQKSNGQNRFYWGIVLPTLCNELWGDSDVQGMHFYLKCMFLREIKPNGMWGCKSGKNSDHTTAEWEKYVETVRRWAVTEHSINLPEPNEISYDEIKE